MLPAKPKSAPAQTAFLRSSFRFQPKAGYNILVKLRCYIFQSGEHEQYQWFHEREDGDVALVCFYTTGYAGLIPHKQAYAPPSYLDNLEKAGHVRRID